MNPSEFAAFTATMEAEMPSMADHLRRHPAMAASWVRELEDINPADAKEALARIRRGDAEGPANVYDRDCFPAFIQRAAAAIRYERTLKAQAVEDSQKTFRSGAMEYATVTMRDAFRQVCAERARARKAGQDPDVAGREMARSLFADMPEDRRDRVKCRTCRDHGWVECWDLGAMQDARRAITQDVEPRPDAWRTCYVSCSCEAGRQHWVTRTGSTVSKDDLPRFDELKWVRVSEGKQALLEWAERYRPANYQHFGAYAGN
jgi:hypothetical protein